MTPSTSQARSDNTNKSNIADTTDTCQSNLLSSNHNQLIDSQFGSQANTYLKSSVHSQGPEFEVLEAILQQEAHSTSTLNVLDLGCGAGHISFCAAQHASSVIAYDLSQQMLTTVEQAATDKGLTNIKTVRGEAESLPLANNSFDMVISRFSAHHWMDVARALSEARRVLKPTGQLIMIDIMAPPVALLDSFLQTIEMLRDTSHVRDYSASDWLAMMGQAKLSTVSVITHKLTLDFKDWIARMQTPEHFITSIRALQQNSGHEVQSYFNLQPDGTFTTDVITMVAKPS